MLSGAGAKAEGLKARVTEEASKLRAAAEKWEAAGTNMSAFTRRHMPVKNRTNEIAEELKALGNMFFRQEGRRSSGND
ncbi:hypothetical protein ERJ75_001112900 [Trypanosoma vivax]|nr:hypothetical protein ERJ75_001112900 [Trypanosoma vivax]